MTLLEQIRASIRECLDTRAGHMAVIDSVIAAAEARDDSALSDAETAQFNEARSAVAAADADLAQLQEREAELVALEEARAAADAVAARFPAPNGSPEIRVGAEPVVYRDGGEYSFLQDAYRSEFGGDWQARERLERHQRMALETRDVGTGAFGALVPPQYLVDMFAPIARAGRPIANSVRRLGLPAGGMTFNVPRGTTGTTTAVQAAENDAVSETNFDETTLAVSLQTIAGQQDVSRQALERGVGIDLVVFGDLASHYATVLDTSVYTAITGTAGIEAVTYTDASPTVAEFFPKLADAVQRVNSNRFMPATAIFMHPRRWGWLTAAVDSTNRPLIGLNAPSNAVGVGVAAEYGQVVGSLFGLPVVTDANMATNLGAGTNEDLVIVAKADDILLWEDGDGAPRELRFEQTNGGNLTVKLVAYGYSATTAGRYPKAIATVGGTGLVTPTF